MDDKVKNVITISSLVLCGIVLCPYSHDRPRTVRHLIWAIGALLLVITNKDIRITVLPLCYLAMVAISGIFAINTAEWICSLARAMLFVLYLSVAKVDAKDLAKAMIALGFVFIISFWYDYVRLPVFTEVCGIMLQRNYFSAAQFFVVPFCWYAYKNGFWRRAAIFVGISMAVNICLISSRSAMLALFVFVFIVSKKHIVWTTGVAMIALALFMSRFSVLSSPVERFEQWRCTLRMIIQNPLGVGAGNWWIVFPNYAYDINYALAFSQIQFRFPHNDFLWMFAELGIIGGFCYLGIFTTALWRSRKESWLFGILSGYMVIAFFSAPHERPFASLLIATVIAMTLKGKTIKFSRALIPVALVLVVIFGCQFRSSIYNKKIKSAQSWAEIDNYTKGRTVFSTMTDYGFPYTWWSAMSKFKAGQYEESVPLFEEAYYENPYNVHVINGMGISYAIRNNSFMASAYFKEALRICPYFKDAEKNLARLQ